MWMAEPISGIQNQTIFLKVSHENSHMVSIQQYAAQAASMSSAQSVARRTEAELRSTRNVENTEQKYMKSATEGKSQGEYYSSERKAKEEVRDKIKNQDNSHILDVRV